MRWPWTRSEEDIRKDENDTKEVRHHLNQEVNRLDRILDGIESKLREGVANGKSNG